ncbi:MAG: InlB B-repeat-containing protein [Acholeplasmatales bacterium]|jgi:uncharacterized repeat protein (TIGR02543 family)|nr:InlB B-repeat-containing protein [Acholeplasmatales bacterium]
MLSRSRKTLIISYLIFFSSLLFLAVLVFVSPSISIYPTKSYVTFVTGHNLNGYQVRIKDEKVVLPKEPVLDGYTFNGWYDDTLCTVPFDNTSVKSSTKVYAAWEKITYTITYILNNGYVQNENVSSYDIETPPTGLNKAFKDGYVFLYWTTAANESIYYVGGGMLGDLVLSANYQLSSSPSPKHKLPSYPKDIVLINTTNRNYLFENLKKILELVKGEK